MNPVQRAVKELSIGLILFAVLGISFGCYQKKAELSESNPAPEAAASTCDQGFLIASALTESFLIEADSIPDGIYRYESSQVLVTGQQDTATVRLHFEETIDRQDGKIKSQSLCHANLDRVQGSSRAAFKMLRDFEVVDGQITRWLSRRVSIDAQNDMMRYEYSDADVKSSTQTTRKDSASRLFTTVLKKFDLYQSRKDEGKIILGSIQEDQGLSVRLVATYRRLDH